MSIRADAFRDWYVRRITSWRSGSENADASGPSSMGAGKPANVVKSVPPGSMPRRVHVAED